MAESSYTALKTTLETVDQCKDQHDYREWADKFRMPVANQFAGTSEDP